MEGLTEQLNDYKDKYEKECKKCTEIGSKLSEVYKEKSELEKEIIQIKNQLTFFREKQSTAENLRLDEEVNIEDGIFENQIKKVTDTFNKQLNDSEEAHRKELCNLQLKVDKLQQEINIRDEMYKEQITNAVNTLSKYLKDSEEAYSSKLHSLQVKVEMLEKEKFNEKHSTNIGRISATVSRGKLESHVQ